MLVLAELLLVHEVLHHLLLVILAFVKLNNQLFPIYFFVVQAVQSVYCLRLVLERNQGVPVLDSHIADNAISPKNLFKVFLRKLRGVIPNEKTIFLVLLFLLKLFELLFCLPFILVLLKLNIKVNILFYPIFNVSAHLSLMHLLLSVCSISKALLFILSIWVEIANECILTKLILLKFQRFYHSKFTEFFSQGLLCPRFGNELYV